MNITRSDLPFPITPVVTLTGAKAAALSSTVLEVAIVRNASSPYRVADHVPPRSLLRLYRVVLGAAVVGVVAGCGIAAVLLLIGVGQ